MEAMDAAACGGGGGSAALAQLGKQALAGRPGVRPAPSSSSSSSSISSSSISRHRHHNDLAQEFAHLHGRSGPHGPGHSPAALVDGGNMRSDPFRFSAVARELDGIHIDPPVTTASAAAAAKASGDRAAIWSSEFHSAAHRPQLAIHPSDPLFAEFDHAFDGPATIGALGAPHAWSAEFDAHHLQHQQPHDIALMGPEMSAHFDEAFERAKQSASWESQFAANHQTDRSQAWDEEFNRLQEQHKLEQDAMPSTDTLGPANADTSDVSHMAEILLDAVDKSANPKLRQSKFVNFIQKLKDKEIAIEGNKVVERIAPVDQKGPKEWGDEFLATHGGGSNNTLYNGGASAVAPIRSSCWEEDFATSGAPLAAGAQGHITATGEASWANEFNAASTSSFPGKSSNANATVGVPSTATGDWAQEFASVSGDPVLDHEGQTERSLYEKDWAETFRSQLTELSKDDQDQGWETLSRAWDAHMQQQPSPPYLEQDESIITGNTKPDIDPRFSIYDFTAVNPYLDPSFSLEFLKTTRLHKNLTESILALEAAVQREPANADAWRMLGLKQQENENDILAIAALRRCTELAPNDLEAYLAISVAYTNENYVHEAYAALGDWISHNPRYAQHLTPQWMTEASLSLSDRHTFLTDKFISLATASATTGQDLDENVQIALGVLYNISSEYDKAVDCFEAALSKRPDDYMLWNKLGATLANSYQPQRAMDAYFNALHINPMYVRARYNLAIACIQIGQHREAAEHLLGALSVQQQNLMHVLDISGRSTIRTETTDNTGQFTQNDAFDMDDSRETAISSLTSAQSNSVWTTLRLLVDSYINRKDLAAACDRRDLEPFHADFDF